MDLIVNDWLTGWLADWQRFVLPDAREICSTGRRRFVLTDVRFSDCGGYIMSFFSKEVPNLVHVAIVRLCFLRLFQLASSRWRFSSRNRSRSLSWTIFSRGSSVLLAPARRQRCIDAGADPSSVLPKSINNNNLPFRETLCAVRFVHGCGVSSSPKRAEDNLGRTGDSCFVASSLS